jgi:4-hydroxy-tetrahydrodipicolinate reductase
VPGVAVFGITGRMGQALVRALREAPQLKLSGAIASAKSSRLGHDAAGEGEPLGVPITADLAVGLHGAAAAIDFSTAQCTGANVEACVAAGVPILIGTTGFDAACRDRLNLAAQKIPVLIAPNTSVGVSVVAKLVSLATVALGTSYDVEIFEAHHRMKRDAPSGTALALGAAVAAARGQDLDQIATYDRRFESAPRSPGSIGFSVLRAAEWLIGRPAGLYGMSDVLGL